MSTEFLIMAVIAVISYFIGSISTAILVGKILGGDDIRSHGSGNAGATNALRTYGKAAAAYVTIGDCLKTSICCVIGIIAAHITPLGAENVKLGIYAAGVGAVIGHNIPIYFGFKGGKGILVSITAFIFANPLVGLTILAICLVVIVLTKYVSLGSILGAVLFIVYALIFRRSDSAYMIFAFTLSLIALFKHRANISRLIHGTERKIGS